MNLLTYVHRIILSIVLLSTVEMSSQKESYRLKYIDNDSTLPISVHKGIQNIFYEVYPKLVSEFNPGAPKEVIIRIDPLYQGVAYASDGQIIISQDWLRKKSADLDLVTHELMHLVQSYPKNSGPGWLTEGLADYVRYKFGLDNEAAGWSLPPFEESQSYKNSYRITARFLVWACAKYDKKLVVKLDHKLRKGEYTNNLWKQITGIELENLWYEYSKNPMLEIYKVQTYYEK